jgi:hypothetical protein
MDPSSANYIGRRIGTTDGTYGSKSTLFVLVECDDASDTSDAFPAGFTGYSRITKLMITFFFLPSLMQTIIVLLKTNVRFI